eukprot:gene9141-12327_t
MKLLAVLIYCSFSLSCSYHQLSRFSITARIPKISRVFVATNDGNIETTKGNPVNPIDNIVNIELNDELRTSFMSYAMSTILSRALPDARDGLKPVHRRVLYAMQQLNLSPESSFRKCARIVGEVLGKFHPHGDQSVYDALVRMAQDFVMLHPLVTGQGNFGSVDADPPAAMRYTEAKLSSLAYDCLLADIKESTVDFQPNFDGNEEEPLVLPARLPMLLLNGASGIAVGMATNIPPHNLGELCNAIIALVDNPNLSDEQLFKIIPAPDFPTGGKIIGTSGIHKMYQTGHGSLILRAKCHTEQITTASKNSSRTRNAIVVTELPYMTNKATLLEKIAELVNDKKLEGVADLRDESDRDGVRVVIELKRDAFPEIVQNNLFKKTSLQVSFSGNMLALIESGTLPHRITLRDGLNEFIKYRFITLRRRTSFQLNKLSDRDHLVEGMLKALKSVDAIIKIMKKSTDASSAKEALMSKPYLFTSEQAESILSLTLRRLTAMEESKLSNEHEELVQQIASLKVAMEDDKKETLALKDKHGVPRKSIIFGEEAELSTQDLLANDRSVIIMTHSGYIKRLPIEEFEAQSRGGKGKAGARLSDGQDSVSQFFTCNDHDSVLFISERGIAYSVKAFQIPLGSRIAKGVPIPQVLPIGQKEKITSVIPVDNFGEEEYLVLLTSNGYIKKTPLKAFETVRANGLTIISLGDNDSLRWARRCDPLEEVIIATKDGFASRFTTEDISATGRTSRGVRSLKLRDGDSMADMDILRSSAKGPNDPALNASYILVITERGYGKRIPIDEFRTIKRGGKGVFIIKFKSKVGGGKSSRESGQSGGDSLSCLRICSPGDEVVLSTSKGAVIRQIAPDDSIVMVDIVPPGPSNGAVSSSVDGKVLPDLIEEPIELVEVR